MTMVFQHCGKDKRLSETYENSTKPDHQCGICKTCHAEVDKEYRSKT